MSEPYPDYPKDENDMIPEPLCWDVLTVMAEYGPVYLWDMNSFAISLESVTGQAEELDAKLTKWATRYDDEFPEPRPFDDQPEEKARFDAEGLALARQLYQRFGGQKKVFYRTLDGAALDASPIPPPPTATK